MRDTYLKYPSQPAITASDVAHIYFSEVALVGFSPLQPVIAPVTFHRTNPVWQFIDNDYATNNEISIQPFNAQYNAYGLPSLMPGSNSVPFLFDLEFPTLAIRYSCDMPDKEEGSGR